MRDEKKIIRSFTIIDKYGCVTTIYGETLAEAMANYEEELYFNEDDDVNKEKETF